MFYDFSYVRYLESGSVHRESRLAGVGWNRELVFNGYGVSFRVMKKFWR